jgi:hypothetical protein
VTVGTDFFPSSFHINHQINSPQPKILCTIIKRADSKPSRQAARTPLPKRETQAQAQARPYHNEAGLLPDVQFSKASVQVLARPNSTVTKRVVPDEEIGWIVDTVDAGEVGVGRMRTREIPVGMVPWFWVP